MKSGAGVVYLRSRRDSAVELSCAARSWMSGEREACGITAQHRLVQQVLRDHRLAQTVGPGDDDVGRPARGRQR